MGSRTMKFLLDTHVWIWYCEGSKRIPKKTSQILRDISNSPIGLAAISPWEVAKKASLGKLAFAIQTRDWIRRGTESLGIEIIPLLPEICYESNYLPPPFHRDPADQMIVATARVCELTLITSDQRIQDYQHVRTLWE